MPFIIVHTYIGLKYDKTLWHTNGCSFPDAIHLIDNDLGHPKMRKLVKLLEKKKIDKHFLNGMKTHLALDYYFHQRYIFPKREQLAKEFNIPLRTAEGYIETALDMIYDKKYPKVKEEVKKAARLYNVKEMASYLSLVTPVPISKIEKALKDSIKVITRKKPYGILSIIKTSLLLRKYSKLPIKSYKLLRVKKIHKRAMKIIKSDCEKEIDLAIKRIRILRNKI